MLPIPGISGQILKIIVFLAPLFPGMNTISPHLPFWEMFCKHRPPCRDHVGFSTPDMDAAVFIASVFVKDWQM